MLLMQLVFVNEEHSNMPEHMFRAQRLRGEEAIHTVLPLRIPEPEVNDHCDHWGRLWMLRRGESREI